MVISVNRGQVQDAEAERKSEWLTLVGGSGGGIREDPTTRKAWV